MTKEKISKDSKEIIKVTRELTVVASERAAANVPQVYSVKNVKADINGNKAKIDIYIIVNFGCKIPDVAYNVQNAVKSVVEGAAEIKVDKVNIHIQGVKIIKEGKDE